MSVPVMDSGKEHIATLCAISTLAIAATGLALGTDVPVALSRPGKRKSPGADVAYSPDRAASGSVSVSASQSSGSRRAVSHPQPYRPHRLLRPSSSLFGRKSPLEADRLSTSDTSFRESRASSLNRRGRSRRPFTQGKDASTTIATPSEEPRPRSSWLRRVSTSWDPSRPASWLSVNGGNNSLSGTSGAGSDASIPHRPPPLCTDLDAPNRLVKRTTSPQFLYSHHSRSSSWYRRPATSHQRSASCTPSSLVQTPSILEQPAEQPRAWPHFFKSSRSNNKPVSVSGRRREAGVRTISTASFHVQPILVSGTAVQPHSQDENNPLYDDSCYYYYDNDTNKYTDFSLRSSPDLDRSFSLRQRRNKLRKTNRDHQGKIRNFTEPSTATFRQHVQASSFSFARPSPLVSGSQSSNSGFQTPSSAPPIFANSSPMMQQQQQQTTTTTRSSFIINNKRSSTTPSDPNTLDSEQDTRLFSDDEDYMDFRSDTAYDSLTTRATASSHSGYRQQPKIETIFDEPSKEHINGATTLEALMQRASLADHNTPQWLENLGIGIQPLDDDSMNIDSNPHPHSNDDHNDRNHDSANSTSRTSSTDNAMPTTPERPSGVASPDRFDGTPLANPSLRLAHDITPSSPASVIRYRPSRDRQDGDHQMQSHEPTLHEDDSIDWSPQSTRQADPAVYSATPTRPYVHANASIPQDPDSTTRSSIFDWSEQQKTTVTAADTTNGITLRPKTVHGKQGEDAPRSRASARKDRNVAHLRSQSVPVNRESGVDVDGSASNNKFSTWGLGHKPVSEEWSEDFEFDDVEEIDEAQVTTLRPVNRDSIRSVRVPQSIIDRQASVRLQFGQVQEFMVFVEELKRLRMQGASLDLLHGQSRQLWEDAENIINLATLNNEEDEAPAAAFQPSSPAASDFFADESSPDSRRISADDSPRLSINTRSVSNPVTPPGARPRGESLAQARNFLQTIQQQKTGGAQDASPTDAQLRARAKMPFDTQDLRKLVDRAGVITRALKEIVRKAEGVSVSPQRVPQQHHHNHTLSDIFNPPEPESSPTPSCKRPGLSDSQSANSFLGSVSSHAGGSDGEERPPSRIRFHAVVEAN